MSEPRRMPSRPGSRPDGPRQRSRTRTTASGPGKTTSGKTTSGKPAASRSGPAAGAEAGSARTAPKSAARPTPKPTPRRESRFTGRAMVLVLVLSVLTISYASSLKAYFQQHSQIEQLRSQIAASESSIQSLEGEKQRWQDPAYVREQARARFGYLMPGQTSYVVIGGDGKPLAAQATLSDPRTSAAGDTPTAWWTSEWNSIELAGKPPSATKHQPLKYLGGNAH